MASLYGLNQDGPGWGETLPAGEKWGSGPPDPEKTKGLAHHTQDPSKNTMNGAHDTTSTKRAEDSANDSGWHVSAAREASKLLDLIAEGEQITFQTFDDAGLGRGHLNRIFHGTIEECREELARLNELGAGTFWMVNRGDGRGRKAENVTGVRALILDLDGAPLEPVLACGVEPHAIVESSLGKWHCYWMVDDCALEDFGRLQSALAAKFGGDLTVKDLPRVLRVPGFAHFKDAGKPTEVKVHSINKFQPYKTADLVARLGLNVAAQEQPSASRSTQSVDPETGEIFQKITEGGRHAHLLKWTSQMNWRGMPAEAIRVAVHAENRRVCAPPEDARVIDQLVDDVIKRYAGQHGRDLIERAKQDAETDALLAGNNAMKAQAASGGGGQGHGSGEGAGGAVPVHARFLDYNLKTVSTPEFIVDNLIQTGVVGIAGMEGVGKTTSLVPLIAKAAHLCAPDDPLKPRLRRKVVWITEDPDQVIRILYAMQRFGNTGCSAAEFREWFRVVEAVRSPVGEFLLAKEIFQELAQAIEKADGSTHLAQPVIVCDTKSAVFNIEDENNNSATSEIIATLKQAFSLPTIVIGHLSKAAGASGDYRSMRGAGSMGGDVHQMLFLMADDKTKKRYLVLGKKRFETETTEVEFETETHQVFATNPLGEQTEMWVRHSNAKAICSGERNEARAQAEEELKTANERQVRGELLDAAEMAVRTGTRLMKTELREKVKRKAAEVLKYINVMMSESWLVEVQIGSDWSVQNKRRASFVIALTCEERRLYLENGTLPVEKTTPPPSWATPKAAAITVASE